MNAPENLHGTVLGGRYQLDHHRAEATTSTSGTMQFDATDLSSQEIVSIRMVPVEQLVDPTLGSTTVSDAVSVFEQQIDVASSLRHPCIETVLDHGDVTLEGERYLFVVGEPLTGGSLREFLDRGRRLTPSQALIAGIDVCRALDAAAKQGIVHGDLRPSRLVFGSDRRVRVVGFGAPLRPLDSLGLEQATYSAPELSEGGARTASSDVYSLALILVEAMTGDVPFVGDTVAAAFANRVGKLLPVNADYGSLAQVLERAGRPNATERFSPREMGQALVQAAEKMPRPTPVDIVGGGMFDGGATQPMPAPAPTPRVDSAPPIVIRTTPNIDTGNIPVASPVVDPTDPNGTPITIGGDETGPIAIDPEQLQALSADDPTSQVVRTKKNWKRRIGVVASAVILVAAAGTGAYFTVLNPKNPVPELKGLSEAEARNGVSQYGWSIKIIKERSDEIAEGQVMRTDPLPGGNLAKRSTLTMWVSQGPTLSALIDVTGLTADEAKAKITEIGLVPTTADVPDENIAAGTVVSWSIPDQPTLKAGDEVVKGTAVAVNVSSGPAARVLPDFTNMPIADVKAKLTELQLVITETEPSGHPEIVTGNVISQSPAAGQSVPRGGTVTITVSQGQTTTLIPSIYGKPLTTVKERLLKYGMVVGKVTGNTRRGLKSATIDGKVVKNFERVVVGKTVDLKFP